MVFRVESHLRAVGKNSINTKDFLYVNINFYKLNTVTGYKENQPTCVDPFLFE